MLERVALAQTRFRTPGLSADGRGVAYGEKLALLFPSLDRLVAFFRGYGERESLDELLQSLQIALVRTPLKTNEVIVTLASDSTDRADRVSSYAKLAGGMAFTGSAQHFVKYRDVGSPLGYDISTLRADAADFILYDDAFEQIYTLQRTLPFQELILRLSAQPVPRNLKKPPEHLLITAASGIANAVLRYLFRWRVNGTVALGEWPAASAFDDQPRRMHIFAVRDVPPRIVALFSQMAGVTVFQSISANIAVELGFAHPIDLDACERLFSQTALVLFRGNARAEVLDPLPPSVPIETLVSAKLDSSSEPTVNATPLAPAAGITLPIRLRPTLEAPRRVVATIIDASEQPWLTAILYRLPEHVLSSLRIARSNTHFFVISAAGIDSLPLGVFHAEHVERVYVPTGFTLEPMLAPQTLRALLPNNSKHVFLGNDFAITIEDAAFTTLTPHALVALAPVNIDVEALPHRDDTLPSLTYSDVSRTDLRDFDQETDKSS